MPSQVRQDVLVFANSLIENGHRGTEFVENFSSVEPNILEINQIRGLLRNSYSYINSEDRASMCSGLDGLLRTKKDSEVYSCYLCEKQIKNNQLDRYTFIRKEGEQWLREDMSVCLDCLKQLRKIAGWCQFEDAYFKKGDKIVCPLYKNCDMDDSCLKPECVERHCQREHPKYKNRPWKVIKRYLVRQPGELITSTLPVGVEFEAVGVDKNSSRIEVYKFNRHIGIGSDLSINNFYNATEVQTPPASGYKLEEILKGTTSSLLKGGFITNDKCGTHIHIDLYKAFGKLEENPLFYKSILAAYWYFEPAFMRLLPAKRVENRFALHIRPVYQEFIPNKGIMNSRKFSKIWYRTDNEDDIRRFKKEIDLNGDECCSGSRHHATKYYWANFHSMIRGEGLEIRSLEGTLNSNTVLGWINLHQKFIETIARAGRPFYEMGIKNPSDELKVDQEFLAMLQPDDALAKFIAQRKEMFRNSYSVHGYNPDTVRVLERATHGNSGLNSRSNIPSRQQRPTGVVEIARGYHVPSLEEQRNQLVRARRLMDAGFRIEERPSATQPARVDERPTSDNHFWD